MKSNFPFFRTILIITGIIAGLMFMAFLTNLFDLKERIRMVRKPVSEIRIIRIGVVTWGGYAGGEYFNKGFQPTKKSRFYREYGFMVDFKLIDELNVSRNAWKSGEIDLMWATVGAFTTEVEELREFQPQIIFQSDWSRGGDAIVVREGINSEPGLRGKKISFAETTPSHTFLLWLLESANLEYSDVDPVKVANVLEAADLFLKGEVDAAVLWSPGDAECLSQVVGSKILQSTREAPDLIADVFVAKKEFVDKNKDLLKDLFEGWLIGAAEINSSPAAKRKAVKILSRELNCPRDICLQAINNVRLCTYGDNVNFFNIYGNYSGTAGEDIYNKMSAEYAKLGYHTDNIVSWQHISNSSIIESVNMEGPGNAAESED